MEVLTIGYEGAKLEDFIETLSIAGVDTLVDIRELPISRRKGFAKTALSDAVRHVGMNYVHIKLLGDPKPGRDAAKAGQFDIFKKIFSEHMKKPEVEEALEHLASLARKSRVCLLCYERKHEHCHRSMVADKIESQEGFSIIHIGVREGVARDAGIQERTRYQFSKSNSARGSEAR